MDNIIVTVTNLAKKFIYDVEVPTDITIDKLKEDLVEVLNGYNPELLLSSANTEFICNRTGKQLLHDETLESSGVWNGDYITIIEV